jgi:hypothetical protein
MGNGAGCLETTGIVKVLITRTGTTDVVIAHKLRETMMEVVTDK